MIEYKVGNLINATEKYIAHGCNSQGVMGSGVAKAIRNKWPEAYEYYKEEYDENGLELGSVLFVHSIIYPFPIICNCITQKDFGRTNKIFVDYKAIRACMKQLAIAASGDAIAMPKIGAGLGGGDWNIISKIIEEEIKGDIIVYVLKEDEILCM